MGKKLQVTRHTYSSFVDLSINRKRSECHSKESSRNTTSTSKDFTQTKSFDEAIDFARNGWDLGLKEYKIEDGVASGGVTDLTPSLAGSIPHIHNYITDFPQQMYHLTDNREYNLPTLHIIVNLAYAGRVDSTDALEFGKSLVSFINAKASSRNIKLTGVFPSQQIGNNTLDIVTIKDFDKSLVINNVAFAFHPSFFRRLWFSIAESWDFLDTWGYGSAISDYKKLLKKNVDLKGVDETLVFKNLQDLNDFKFTEENIDKFLIKM